MISPDVLPLVSILLAGLPLRVVCAWCDLALVAGVAPTSHGICAGCAARLEAEASS